MINIRTLLLTSAIAFVTTTCFAQSVPELLKTVVDSVVKDAAVVILKEESTFEITDIDRAYLKTHKIFTVRNSQAEGALFFNEFSNKVVALTDAEIKVYDARGNQTGRYKMKDMRTEAVGEGLVDDGKVTYFRIPTTGYPVTVELDYETRFKGTLFYPSYNIQGSDEAVMASDFTVKIPDDMEFRFKEKNIRIQPTTSTDGKYKLYHWSVKNLPPIEYEEGTTHYEGRYPRVLLAPNRFRIYDTDGDMSTWKNFGLWEYGLTKGLNELPGERIAFFKELVKNASTEKEKISIVYDYLQKNFRYVSIQLGIGGYKPFPALFTDQKKYGDCKALSFYTHAILTSLNIKSYVALINAEYNREPVDPAFPCNQFNHMILCVPSAGDTTWLECTSRSNDFGVLGSFTENRNALLITENGGELVSTPKSKPSNNRFSSRTNIELNEDGSGKVSMSVGLSGEFKMEFLHMLEEKIDDQKKFLINGLGIKQPDGFSITKQLNGRDCIGNIVLQIEKIPEFTAGSKLFLNKHLFKMVKKQLPEATHRRLDFYFQFPFEKTDTAVYKLPAGYVVDQLPQATQLQNEQLNYQTRSWFDEREQAVYCVSKFTLTNHVVKAAQYDAVKKLLSDVIKDDQQHIVIKKK